jgi:hypothetical protein
MERTFSSATVDANLFEEWLDDAVHIRDAARRAAGRSIIMVDVCMYEVSCMHGDGRLSQKRAPRPWPQSQACQGRLALP